MKFNQQELLDRFLNGIFQPYLERVPDVKKITQALIDKKVIEKQEDILNDHIAFRTLKVPHLGINSLEKAFLHHNYTKKDSYYFKEKKLDAYWYAPPSFAYPRVFISELRIEDLSLKAQKIIEKYTQSINADPLDAVDINNPEKLVQFFHTPLWDLPTYEDYKILLDESEYAAWVIYNRYYLNHYTISIHELSRGYDEIENFNAFLKNIGIKLNTAGGEIKKSGDGLLLQSSSVAEKLKASFACGKIAEIPGSYVEFAQRKALSQYANLPKIELHHRRDGFETANADKIFESTFASQVKKEK